MVLNIHRNRTGQGKGEGVMEVGGDGAFLSGVAAPANWRAGETTPS